LQSQIINESAELEKNKQIEESKRLYEAITQNTPDLIYVFDLNYRFIYANEALLKMWGRRWDESIGKSMSELGYEPWHAEMHEREIELVIATKKPVRGEISFPHATLGNRIYDYIFAPVIDQYGHVEAIAGTTRDITNQVDARKQIEESEIRFRNMVSQAPVAISVLRGENYVVEVANEKQLQLWGKTKEQVLNMPIFKAIPEGAGQGFEELLSDVFRTGKPFIAKEIPTTLTRNGKKEIFYANFIYEPLYNGEHKIDGIISISTDVTEQVTIRQKIEESEQRFRLAIAGSNQVVCSHDKNLKYTWIYNPRPDFRAEDIIGKTDKDLHEPSTAAILTSIKQHVLDTGISFNGDVELEVGGQETNYAFHIEAIKDADGNITGTGTALDITERIKTQQQIKESEEKLNIVIEASELGFWELDITTNDFNYSDRYREIMGYRHKKDITLNETEKLVHPDYIEAKNDAIKKAHDTGVFYFTGQIIWEDHSIHWIESKGKVFYDEDNNPVKIIGTTEDITEEKQRQQIIEESEKRFRSLAQTLPQLVWITDAQGNAEFASFRWKEYSGIEPGGEKEWKEIVHPDDYGDINAAWVQSLATGTIYSSDVRLKSKDGEYRWHSVKGEPVLEKDNKIVKWVGAFTDIHDQKIKEEKKDEFISVASHEMKTPLTTAKAYLQMLELSLDETNADAILYAKKAGQSVDRLNELIKELLDVSKIRLGKLNYSITTFDFNDMVDGTIENIQLTSSTHTIVKSGKVFDKVTGDKERLQQVIVNLLNNAIKYSPGAEKVFITMEQENDTVKVSVKDRGIGIAKKSLNNIFEKYHRVEEHAVHFQGLGIGLFISYEIIQRHHGKLWAESKPGSGSTFYFTLPINYIPPPE
jgi:PAS domain S-box-containing protein